MVAIATIVGALSLSGCTPAPQWDPDQPTILETPEVVWENGPPSGEFESHEAVIAARAANLGISLASNNHDYTIAQLTDYVGADYIEWLYDGDVADTNTGYPTVDPGPYPEVVIGVTEAGDRAEVVFCSSSKDWYISKDHPEPSVDVIHEVAYVMQRDESGNYKLETIDLLTGRDCDYSEVAIGYFSPAPELPVSVPAESVRPPLGYVAED